MRPPSDESTIETYHRGRKRREVWVGLAVAAALAYSVLRWKPFRVEIAGSSMAPTLRPGDWAVGARRRLVRRGDVVVVEHPHRSGFEVVKRVVAVAGTRAPNASDLGGDEWWVEGDRLGESTDSRHFGPVRTRHIKGVLRMIYWPPSRSRLL